MENDYSEYDDNNGNFWGLRTQASYQMPAPVSALYWFCLAAVLAAGIAVMVLALK
jgi:hypothetical protein